MTEQPVINLWRTFLATSVAAVIALATGSGTSALQRPITEDISPNTPNGVVNGGPSTAGLTVALAGDQAALYAVSLNAGIWKSVHGGNWKQLAASPPRACCIAVDPNWPEHLAVGERNGLASDVRLNGSGVWESRDGGRRWSYVLDPLSLTACRSQAVPTVAFSPRSALLVGTTVGIGVRRPGSRTFDFRGSPPDIGPITAIASSHSRLWARTRTHLIFSDDDGRSWMVKPFPTECGGLSIGFHSRGDVFSLAAFDTRAYLPCKPSPDTTGNRTTMLIYDQPSDRWRLQFLPSGDGTGLGGRRFVKSFLLTDPALKEGIGGKQQLFFGAGQEIHQALGENADGTIRWDTPVQTDWAGPAHATNHLHSDTWDVHIGPSFGSSGASCAWIACDGGVFRGAPATSGEATRAGGRVQQWRWTMQNDGLHTHHIHTLAVLPAGGSNGGTRLAYPTSDNDAWFRDGATGVAWQSEDCLGDANWTAEDVGNPSLALMVRHMGLGVLTAFGPQRPTDAAFDEGGPITLNPESHFDGPTAFRFIQTLKGETPDFPLLDAVMLVQLPLKFYDSQGHLAVVPGPLGSASETGSLALIRNRRFAAGPDPNRFQFKDWTIEADNLPPGAYEFWVSGGHERPFYYVLARENGKLVLYRGSQSTWRYVSLTDETGRLFDLIDGGEYGPVFVNPYDPKRLFVLGRTGVRWSVDGGAAFHEDPALTALLTASGKYPLTAGEMTGNSRDVVLASRANALATLADVAFDRDHPEAVVAASPFTGVFYAADDHHIWRSLTPFLPTPLSAPSAIGLDSDAVYVATEGRSLVRISRYTSAPLATYFELQSADGAGPRLCTADRLSLPNTAVRILIRSDDGRKVSSKTVRTDGKGRLILPVRMLSGRVLVELSFAGSADYAPAEQTGFTVVH